MNVENVRIAVLNPYDEVISFLDNNVEEAMNYYDDTLHTYLKGSAYTYEFTTLNNHEDVKYLVEGNKLSFIRDLNGENRSYYLNIVDVEKDESEIKVLSYGLLFELLNEECGPYKSDSAMSMESYINALGFEHSFSIGINEVSDKSISNEWTGTETILSRLYSIANVFSAEIEFITVLNNDYSLKDVVLNIYREHDENNQGMGKDKTSTILRYGIDIESISKKSDITELFTSIRPTGSNGLTLKSLNGKKEYDENNSLLFEVVGIDLRSPQSRSRFPSTIITDNDKDMYIVRSWSYETDNVNVLYSQAKAELKKYMNPKVTYDIKGYVDADIGDTFTIEDSEYEPVLYLEARVTEQEISFTDPTNNKTTFDNFEEKQSEIGDSLIKEMYSMIEKNKKYDLVISSNKGTVFKNTEDASIFTAYLKDNGKDVSDDFIIQWYKDDVFLFEGNSINVHGTDFSSDNKTIVYTVKAYLNDIEKVNQQFTCVFVSDGEKGEQGEKGDPGENGDPGKSVVSIEHEFYLSTSKKEQTGGEWLLVQPEWIDNTYLWIRNKITYENPSSIEYTEPYVDASWEVSDIVQDNLDEYIDSNDSRVEVIEKDVTDVSKDASNANSTIDGLIDELGSYAKKDEIPDTSNFTTVSEVNTLINKSNDNFTVKIEEINRLINELGETSNENFSQFFKYFKFDTDGLTIGRSDSIIRLVMDNDIVKFMCEGKEVAYFSDSKLY
ncbi:MAG: phage tail protein, partial [Floccifex sp.]